MKKSTKVCLVLAALMFLLSVGCTIAGFAAGGNPVTAAEDILENVAKAFTGYDSDFDEDYDVADFQLAGEFSIEDFDSVSIDMEVGKVVVKSVSGESCRIWIDDSDFEPGYSVSAYSEGDTIYINDDGADNMDIEINISSVSEMLDLLRNKDLKNIGVKVIVEVPQNSLDKLEAAMELGAIKLYDVTAREMKLSVEAGAVYGQGHIQSEDIGFEVSLGSVRLQKLTADSVTMNVECGEIRVLDLNAGQLNADVEMGTIIFQKVLAVETNADVEMGDINIQFVGIEQDYDISYDVEIGDVDTDGNAGHNSEALYKVQLDCEMGNIDLSFLNDPE